MPPTATQTAKTLGQELLWPVTHLSKAIAAADQALKAEPAVKAAVTALLTKIQQTAVDAAAAAAQQGLNITADLAAASAAGALLGYITATFLPAIEAAFTAPATATPKPAKASPPRKPKPAPAPPAPTQAQPEPQP